MRDWLNNTIIHRRQLEHLTLPLAFFRKEANHYHSFQYQNAFINFYLMLEGFFGDGEHYNNNSTKIAFDKSEILEYVISETILYFEKINGEHYKWLKETYNKLIDKKGIIHILAEHRGKLSHFSLKNSNTQKNPFKDRDYEHLAFLQ